MIVTEELILLCLNELEKQAQQKQIYNDYYNGEHSILEFDAELISVKNRNEVIIG